MALDEVNEMINDWLKKPPSTEYLSNVVKRSTHLMFGRKALMEHFGKKSNSSSRPSEEKDVLLIKQFLYRCNIFCDHTPTKMDNEYFWRNVRKTKESTKL